MPADGTRAISADGTRAISTGRSLTRARGARAALVASICACAALLALAPGGPSAATPSTGAGLTPAASTPAPHPPKPPARPWEPGIRAAMAYAHIRAGQVSFAVRMEHHLWGWQVLRTVPSASVLKAMLLVAYLDDPRVRYRPLDSADHALIDPMIQHSDNAAASAVLGFVGSSEVYGVAHRAGMSHFTLDPVIWGLSRIDAADQSRFFLHIDSQVGPRHRASAMHLLATVTPSQRWGIGEVHLPGWWVYFKGGWGAGTGEVEHQVVLLRSRNVRVALAVLITSSPSHAYAKVTLRGLFERLLHGVSRLLPREPPHKPHHPHGH